MWKIERYAIKAYSNVCKMKWIPNSKIRYREIVIANDAEQLSFTYSSIQHIHHPRSPQSSIKKWSLRAERAMRFIDVWKYNFNGIKKSYEFKERVSRNRTSFVLTSGRVSTLDEEHILWLETWSTIQDILILERISWKTYLLQSGTRIEFFHLLSRNNLT